MGGGDGASWGSIDYGQLGNPCADRPNSRAARCARRTCARRATAADPTDYNGSIIRVDRETGAALPDNPLSLAPLLRQPRVGRRGAADPRRRPAQSLPLHDPAGDRRNLRRRRRPGPLGGDRPLLARRPPPASRPDQLRLALLRGRPRRRPEHAPLAGGRRGNPRSAKRSIRTPRKSRPRSSPIPTPTRRVSTGTCSTATPATRPPARRPRGSPSTTRPACRPKLSCPPNTTARCSSPTPPGAASGRCCGA